MTEIFERRDEIDDAADFKIKCDSQSLSFYSDIETFISNHITGYHSMSLLDVGARTAAGTALLRAIHHPRSFARLKLHQVTALDLDAVAIEKAKLEYPDLEYLAIDVSALKGLRKWDIVLTSHTIEHASNPDSFLQALEDVASRYVIVACPFAEDYLSVGHLNRFNIDFFEKRGFSYTHAYRSQHWHGGLACIAIKTIQ